MMYNLPNYQAKAQTIVSKGMKSENCSAKVLIIIYRCGEGVGCEAAG